MTILDNWNERIATDDCTCSSCRKEDIRMKTPREVIAEALGWEARYADGDAKIVLSILGAGAIRGSRQRHTQIRTG